MNTSLNDVVVTDSKGRMSKLDRVFIRGSQIVFVIFPDMLGQAPMFKRVALASQGITVAGGLGRGRQAAIGAKGWLLVEGCCCFAAAALAATNPNLCRASHSKCPCSVVSIAARARTCAKPPPTSAVAKTAADAMQGGRGGPGGPMMHPGGGFAPPPFGGGGPPGYGGGGHGPGGFGGGHGPGPIGGPRGPPGGGFGGGPPGGRGGGGRGFY